MRQSAIAMATTEVNTQGVTNYCQRKRLAPVNIKGPSV